MPIPKLKQDSIKRLQDKASQLDQSDTLAKYIDEFLMPDGVIYLDGNSLGPLSKPAQARARQVVEQQWGNSLIAGWNEHNWINLPSIVGKKIAPIIGATSASVISCDSISVNLFKLLSGALLMQAKRGQSARTTILSQSDNFPTDVYMVQGLEALLGGVSNQHSVCQLVTKASDEIIDYINAQGEHVAVLLLSHVNFKNGRIFDMQAITKLAHEKGILLIWDLAHSAGVLPLHLDEYEVDFAVGCTYKYLNGGPGSPGFIYIAERHMSAFCQPLSGWMGHKSPFEFKLDYEKAQGVEQMLSGTPSIISMSILDAALDIFANIDIHHIRQKSIALNQFFQECVDTLCAGLAVIENQAFKDANLGLACPEDANKRGSQISYAHPHAYAICQALIARGVIADFRAPNILRIGFSPLYLSYKNMLEAASILCDVLQKESYLEPQYQVKHQVT